MVLLLSGNSKLNAFEIVPRASHSYLLHFFLVVSLEAELNVLEAWTV